MLSELEGGRGWGPLLALEILILIVMVIMVMIRRSKQS